MIMNIYSLSVVSHPKDESEFEKRAHHNWRAHCGLIEGKSRTESHKSIKSRAAAMS